MDIQMSHKCPTVKPNYCDKAKRIRRGDNGKIHDRQGQCTSDPLDCNRSWINKKGQTGYCTEDSTAEGQYCTEYNDAPVMVQPSSAMVKPVSAMVKQQAIIELEQAMINLTLAKQKYEQAMVLHASASSSAPAVGPSYVPSSGATPVVSSDFNSSYEPLGARNHPKFSKTSGLGKRNKSKKRTSKKRNKSKKQTSKKRTSKKRTSKK